VPSRGTAVSLLGCGCPAPSPREVTGRRSPPVWHLPHFPLFSPPPDPLGGEQNQRPSLASSLLVLLQRPSPRQPSSGGRGPASLPWQAGCGAAPELQSHPRLGVGGGKQVPPPAARLGPRVPRTVSRSRGLGSLVPRSLRPGSRRDPALTWARVLGCCGSARRAAASSCCTQRGARSFHQGWGRAGAGRALGLSQSEAEGTG
jgi:hypothetical protein